MNADGTSAVSLTKTAWARISDLTCPSPIDFCKGKFHGHFISTADTDLFWPFHRLGYRVRKAREILMSFLYLLSGILALGLFIYLGFALLFPEEF
jgi:K+-transporting ATPase KdpF subunit